MQIRADDKSSLPTVAAAVATAAAVAVASAATAADDMTLIPP